MCHSSVAILRTITDRTKIYLRQQSMANVPTLGCSQVEAGIVDGCSYEEDKDIDQTNCSVVVKSSIGFPEAEELEGHYGSDKECD
eukprot:Em0008g924a